MPHVAELVIHIVDDEQIVRDSLGFLLKSMGYQARTYSGADEFLTTVRYDAPCCMLLDFFMGEKGGLQLLAELPSHGLDFPVIAMTGSGDSAAGSRAIALGAAYFIEKPFGKQAIAEAVTSCAARAQEAWTNRKTDPP